MTTIIATNSSASDISIEDLGITLPAFSSIVLTDIFSLIDIVISKDLKDKVSSGIIVINDGLNDLDIINGLDHLSIHTNHEDSENIDGGQPYEIFLDDQVVNGGIP